MDAIVCVKQIPDPETPAAAFRVDEAAMRVLPAQGISPVISPFDAQAVEAALRLKDAAGEGTVNIISLGPDSARDAIKHSLAMGADEGYHLHDDAFDGGDAWTTALALSKAIQQLGVPDVILFGRQAADWDQGSVGSIVAELLDLPSATVLRAGRGRRRRPDRLAGGLRRLRDDRAADPVRADDQQRVRRPALPAAAPDHARGA